jgi:hypothetical protein
MRFEIMVPGLLFFNMIRSLPILLLSATTFAVPAFGWGCEGHQIVALIARAHLTPAASAAVDELLRANPIDPALNRYCMDHPADLMADAATWADDVRRTERNGPWHYVNIPLSVESGDAMKWCPPIGPSVNGQDRPGCVINALEMEWRILADKTKPAPERAEALRYVIHFTGDVHQPLHVDDNNDGGGNCTTMRFFDEARPVNLHSIWDTRLIEHDLELQHLSQADYAHMLDVRFASHWREWGEARPDIVAWAWESHDLDRKVVYADLDPPIAAEAPAEKPDCDAERSKVGALHINVGEGYFAEAIPIVDERLAQAGYRLAAILNQSF